MVDKPVLQDKVVWITGASRGIGQAVALCCASAGARTVLVASQRAHLEETAALIRAAGGVEPLLADYDITSQARVGSAFSTLFKDIKRLDVLVNNAGIMQESLLGMLTAAPLEQMFAVNVFAAIYHMQYAARLMARSGGGSIINMSSIMGHAGGGNGLTGYSASKAALIGATLSAAKELAAQQIRVNAVAPGFVATDLVSKLGPEKLQQRLGSIRMGRAGTAEDIAEAVLFLASDQSRYITGQVLGVDGGMIP
jgi:3-oxoacyl-[acyl-carrier protein] reductase